MIDVPDNLMRHAVLFMLVTARVGGLLLFTPVLASNSVPFSLRAMLVAVLSVAIYPLVPAGAADGIVVEPVLLLPVVASEALIGLAIGLLAMIPIVSVQLAGLMIGQQMGLGLANIFNPAIDTETTILGQMMLFIAIAIFLTLGGLEFAFEGVARSLAHTPPGVAMRIDPPLELLLGLLASGFELAVRIAAPVLCIIMLETVATAFMMKTMPQLNVLSIGFATKTVLGIGALIVSLVVAERVIGESMEEAFVGILRWIGG